MAIPMNDYLEFDQLIDRLWNQTPLIGLMLHDSRSSHAPIAEFLRRDAGWLDELAVQSGVYILFPLRQRAGVFVNPSSAIARNFGLGANRLPGIILLTTGADPKNLPSNRFLFVPLSATDFSRTEEMETVLSNLFTLVQEALGRNLRESELLDAIRKDLSRLRRRERGQGLVKNLRAGAQVVLIKIPERLLSSFAEGFGKALGSSSLTG